MIGTILKSFRTAWGRSAWRAALLVALASDALSFAFALLVPMQWMVDSVTALALFALLGFRWPLLPALIIEVIPGVALFPAWTLAVAAYAAADDVVSAPPTPPAPGV